MTEFDRLMREADIDRARGEVVRAAKAWRDAIGPRKEAETNDALIEAVDELLRMEEKR